ncbi:MAG TPA: hypothetical protein VGL35_12035 [Rhizomicrobium sp.]|jgi:hypothetical protein
MQHKARHNRRGAATRANGWQRLAIAFAMLAFAFQSYAIGSHVHPVPILADTLPGLHHTGAPAHPSKSDDPANCPLCQEMLLYGSYVIPTAISLAPPDIVPALEISVRPVFAAVTAASHSWQGRAPPRI